MKKSLVAITATTLVLGALIAAPGMMRPAPAALVRDEGIQLESIGSSTIAKFALPSGAMRVKDETVPDTISKALKNLADGAGPKCKQGKVEVLVWSAKSDKASAVKAKISSIMKTNKWEYEESAKEATTGDMTMISAVQKEPVRRGILGFWAPTDDALVLAWTEILPASASASAEESPAAEPATEEHTIKNIFEDLVPSGPGPETPPVPGTEDKRKTPVQVAKAGSGSAPAGAAVFTVPASQVTVNVMKNAKPPTPSFPALPVKRGLVRGYVKDAKGRAIKGAVIGIRSSAIGGAYSGTTGKTDANGYYEIAAPWGAAEFYTASYTMEYGDGRAAFGLRPVDGEADTFATANGCVENWVIAAYGVADPDSASDQPHYAGNYYGGSFSVSYNVMDSRFPNGTDLPDGSEIELTLTPVGPLIDGSTGKTIIVRRAISESSRSSFYVNNIPVGQYRVTGKMTRGGNARLKFRESGPMQARPFGLEPKEGDDVVLTFRPGGAKSGMAAAQHGNWEQLDFTVSR